MRDGRIDTRFPRLRFPHHDRLLRSILLHPAHRTGTVCARISWSFDSPFRFRPFRVSSSIPALRFSTCPVRSTNLSKFDGTHFMWSVFSAHVISTNCIRISKPNSPVAGALQGFALSSKTQRSLECRQADSASVFGRSRGAALPLLNFTAESTSNLRRLRNSRLSPRVQTEKCECRFGWSGYGCEDIRRAQARGGGWEGVRRTAAPKREPASAVCAKC